MQRSRAQPEGCIRARRKVLPEGCTPVPRVARAACTRARRKVLPEACTRARRKMQPEACTPAPQHAAQPEGYTRAEPAVAQAAGTRGLPQVAALKRAHRAQLERPARRAAGTRAEQVAGTEAELGFGQTLHSLCRATLLSLFGIVTAQQRRKGDSSMLAITDRTVAGRTRSDRSTQPPPRRSSQPSQRHGPRAVATAQATETRPR